MFHSYFIPTQAAYPDGNPFYLTVSKSVYDDFLLSIKHLRYSFVEHEMKATTATIYHYVELTGKVYETDD